jgi:hypothetical protein
MARKYSEADRQDAVRRVLDNGWTVAPVARELGIPATTIRRWIDQHHAREWAATVDVHFGFVAEYGFRLSESDASWGWVWRVAYRRTPLEIIVDYERRDSWIDLKLVNTTGVRAVRRDPLDRGDITACVLGYDLVQRRAEDPQRMLELLRGPASIEVQLAFWADILRAYGQDFLDGDQRVFETAQAPS